MKDSLTVSTSLRELLSRQESAEKLPVISPTKQVPNQVEGSSDVLIIGWCQQVSHRNNNHSHIYPEGLSPVLGGFLQGPDYLAGPG